MEKWKNTALSMEERTRALMSELTLEEKIGLLSTHQLPVERLGIKEWFVGAEVARGYVSRNPEEPTTVFPQPIGMSGMFDDKLMFKLGEIAGKEARVLNKRHPSGHLNLWGPTVDMCRNPLWGRNEEAYGEDPYLTGRMSAEYTKGMAGARGEYLMSIPTLKHFCANNNEEGRGNCDANIEPRTKHEYYYQAFKPAITEGGAYGIMTAYNELSGVPGMINPDVENILKKDWGLGLVVTDGGDFSQNVTSHRYGKCHAETLALAFRNGTDLMTDDYKLAIAAAHYGLENGILTEEDIDKSVYNSLLARFRLGEFDEVNPYDDIDESIMECDEHKALNHEAALKQMVLLKNNGILPFEKGKSIAVIGINGNDNLMDWYTGHVSYKTNILDGVRSIYPDAVYDDGCDLVAIKSKLNGKYIGVDDEGNVAAIYDEANEHTIFKKSEYGHNEVTYRSMYNNMFFTAASYKADSEGTYRWFSQEILKPEKCGNYVKYNTYFKKLLEISEDGKIGGGRPFGISDSKLFTEELIEDGIIRAREVAKKADYVIICTGNDPMIVAREMYDRKTLRLPERQSELVKACYVANQNAVMTLVSSYPYSINEENEYLPAIIYTTHAGPELGNAFAKVISGEYNPAGRLAQTWYKSEEELPPILDYDIIENDMTYLYYKGTPLYPFGYGISYSKFEYTDMKAEQKGDTVTVSLKVKNISDTDGDEVVQIYFHPENARVKRPLKQLCAFERRFIKAGDTAELTFDIELCRFEFYDVTREKLCTESGDYTLFAGASSSDIRQETSLYIKGEEIPSRDMTMLTKAINYDNKFGTKMKYSKQDEEHYMLGGGLVFKTCDLGDSDKVRLICGSVVGEGKVTLELDGEVIAEVTVPPSVNVERFFDITEAITTEKKKGNLTVSLNGSTTLKALQFVK